MMGDALGSIAGPITVADSTFASCSARPARTPSSKQAQPFPAL
jgi:hypothetical protein